MATFKHISSKNADYGAAEQYLTFEHDEFTMKPTLDGNGQIVPRTGYLISSLNCGGEDFAIACMRSNLKYGKNQKREDVKSHHYIISFDPRDAQDNGLTVDRAQQLGEQFCKEHFPGHQALVCTHPDGHNHSGNIHVHIVINSLRIEEVPLLPYMERPADTREGCKHRCTDAAMEEFNEQLWTWCEKDAQRLHYKYKVPIQELWEGDKESLLALPEHPFPIFRYETVAVNKCGLATIDTNKYGLSPALAGWTIQAKIFFDHVEFYHDHRPVAQYRRSYGHNEELYDWTQYVGALLKKPGAVEHTRFFQRIPEQWRKLLAQSKGRERKGALQLLSEIVNDGNAGLCEEALAMAAENGRTDPDSIRQCYYMIARKEFRPEPLKLEGTAPRLHYDPNLTAYDGLTGGACNA